MPEGIKYIPVDYIAYSKDTVVCDLNRYEFPLIPECQDGEGKCILLIGGIQIVTDWRWLLKRIAENCDTFICNHHDFARVSREYRRTSFNNNNVVFNHQIILEMQKLGFVLTEAYDFHLRNVFMKFEKRRK